MFRFQTILFILLLVGMDSFGQRLDRLVVNDRGLAESRWDLEPTSDQVLQLSLNEDHGACAYVHAFLSPDSSADAVHQVTFVCLREYQGKLEWYDERTADIRSQTTHYAVSFTLIDEGLFQIVMRDKDNAGRIYGHSWFKVNAGN